MLGNVKGAAVREFFSWYGQKYGRDALVELGRSIPSEQTQFDIANPALGFLSGAWYPAEMVHAFLDALIAGRTPEQVEEILAEGTDATMRANLGSVYKRFLVRVLMSPDRYVRHAQSLWNMHFDTGSLTVQKQARHEISWRVDGWKSHHRLLCRTIVLSEPAVFGAMGCSDVTTHSESCVSNGAAFCGHVIRWRD